MPTELWGEGRVVGYSAYEIYVKQHLALNPRIPPATERQWLASSLASGASLLLKIVADSTSRSRGIDDNWYRDYVLPESNEEKDYSLLCAANTIVGSFFDGEGGYATGSNFAHKVISYGNLIKNAAGAPATDGTTVNPTNYPLADTGDFSEYMQQSLKNYMKIIDGIVIQPGTWKDTGTIPTRDYDDNGVDLSKSPTIRLHFRGPVDHDFELLLTGFSIRAVVAGESGFGGSVTDNTQFNKDGAFLGPGQYPWANKIVFSIPNAFEQYLRYNGYSRELPSNTTAQTPKGQPIIDMEKTDPSTYYSGTKTGFSVETSKQPVDVTKLNVVPEEADVLTVYQRNTNLPPAIYGSKVIATGEQAIYPLDTIAPGTVKMYTSESDAKTHQKNTPNNYSIYKNTSDNTIYHVKGSGDAATGVPVARQDSANANYTHDSNAGQETAQVIEITTGDIKRRALSMQNASGTNRTISSPPSNVYATNNDDLYWAAFLDILANDKKIDILGDDLKKWKLILSQILSGPSDKRYIINISSGGELELREISLDVENIAKGITIKGHGLGYLNFADSANPDVTATTIKVAELLFYQSIQGILPPSFVNDFSFDESTMVSRLTTLNNQTFARPVFDTSMCRFGQQSGARYMVFADHTISVDSQATKTEWIVPIYPYVNGYYRLAVLWPAVKHLSGNLYVDNNSYLHAVNPDYVGSYSGGDNINTSIIQTHSLIKLLSPLSAVPTDGHGVKVANINQDSIPTQIITMKSTPARQITAESAPKDPQYATKSLYEYILDLWKYEVDNTGKVKRSEPTAGSLGFAKDIVKSSVFTQYVDSGPISNEHIFGQSNFYLDNMLPISSWFESKVVEFSAEYTSELLPMYYSNVDIDVNDSEELTYVKSPALTDEHGIDLDIYGMSDVIKLPKGSLSWTDLLVALGSDLSVEIRNQYLNDLSNTLESASAGYYLIQKQAGGDVVLVASSSSSVPISIPIASSGTLGGVKINGGNLSIDRDTGLLSATDTVYIAASPLFIDTSNNNQIYLSYASHFKVDNNKLALKIAADNSNLKVASDGSLSAVDTKYTAAAPLSIDANNNQISISISNPLSTNGDTVSLKINNPLTVDGTSGNLKLQAQRFDDGNGIALGVDGTDDDWTKLTISVNKDDNSLAFDNNGKLQALPQMQAGYMTIYDELDSEWAYDEPKESFVMGSALSGWAHMHFTLHKIGSANYDGDSNGGLGVAVGRIPSIFKYDGTQQVAVSGSDGKTYRITFLDGGHEYHIRRVEDRWFSNTFSCSFSGLIKVKPQ